MKYGIEPGFAEKYFYLHAKLIGIAGSNNTSMHDFKGGMEEWIKGGMEI